MPTKFRFESASDEELVESCKKEVRPPNIWEIRLTDGRAQIDCGDYHPPICNTTTKKVRSSFPKNTVAIIVDVRQQVGAFRIYTIGTGKFITGVGTEEAEKMVMIPWNNDWNYDTMRLGYMLKH